MSGETRRTRRTYLKTLGVAGAAGLGGLASAGSAVGRQGGPIPMGSLVPVTGSASPYGEGMQRAVNIAVSDVNDAGGPLDRQISMSNRDSETQPSRAVVKLRSLISESGIVGFVGAFSSGVSTTLAPVAADSRVMEVSHGSTSPVLAEAGYRDGVKYFARTSPNDAQQGIVMARAMENQVGASTVAFLHVDNPYGAGLAEKASQAFGGETTAMVGYGQDTTDFTSTLDSVFADDPDAVGFIGYPGNARTIFRQWSNGGYGGQWVLSEAVNSPEFISSMSDVLEGMYLASPSPESTEGRSRYLEKIGDANTLFAPHAYDALFLQALAIEKAGEASGTAIARNIRSVSRPPGTNVTVGEFQRAKELLGNGEQINYQGASSPVDLNERLEPLNRFALLRISGGETETVETIPRSFFEGRLYEDGGTTTTAGTSTTTSS
ncbi:ABC transporter substrate-binding protein [Halorussus sp. JP-T4]|nr:ABC transporter substrate-binding protein [Halorussus sp. JP-T4]